MHEYSHHKSFLASVLDNSRTDYESTLAYMADIVTDLSTQECDLNDPRVYAGKHKLNDPIPTRGRYITLGEFDLG